MTSAKALALTLLAAAFVPATLPVVNASSAKADFTLSVSPASRAVAKGTVASYTVTMTPNNGHKAIVTLAATLQSGSGTTASFAPATVSFKSTRSTVSVVTANANTGTWSITVTGTDGTSTRTATASVTVNPSPQKFTLGVTPPSAQVLPGDTALYGVTITRQSGYTSAVTLTVSGLPIGATATFSPPSPVVGSSTTLQVVTSSSTPLATSTLFVTGSGSAASNQTVTAQLVVTDKGKPFAISGSPSGALTPGAAPLPINLTLSNPNNPAMNVTNLTVTVTGTSAGSPCAPSNYAVSQYSGAYPLALGKGQTATLQQLGVPQAQWPTLQLTDDPILNQDGCKNVAVFLSYTGAGQG